MSDLKIGDRVTGIKGNTRVTGTVMNIKEGHVHIKAPVSGVYAPLVSIVPLHKVTKLGEGAMKRKAEAEDDRGMSDYMHDAQTSSAPFDDAKPAKPHADQFGNKIKIGNVAKNLAKQGMRGVKKEEVEQIDEVGDTKKGKDALASYITKASRQSIALRGLGIGFDSDKNMYAKKALKARTPKTKEKAKADIETSGRLASRFNRKAYNRTAGISRAAVRLAKEEVESIDEVNSRDSFIAAQDRLTPRAKNVKQALSNKKRDVAATNKYGKVIGKIAGMKPKEVVANLKDMGEEADKSGLSPEQIARRKKMDAADFKNRRDEMNSKRQAGTASLRTTYREEVEQIDEMDKEMPLSREQRDNMAKQKPAEYAKLYNKVSPEMRKKLNLPAKLPEEVEQVEEGYKGRRAFGSAYDKTHDPFQDSKRRFKSRELEHELAHEAPSGPAHHDQTPHDVHIDGKKWKTFGSAGHAHNVANKLSISGKKASVHKTPIAEKAPPGWEGTVKAMKKHPEIDNPFALAWWMKRQGAKSHKGEK